MPSVELKTVGGGVPDEPIEQYSRRSSMSEYDIPKHHGAEPVRWIKLIHSHPKTSCTVTCCGIFVWFLLAIFSGAIATDKMTDVGLSLPDAYWTKHAEAFYMAKEEASFTIDTTACNRSSPDYYINLVWKEEGANLLTESKLTWFHNEIAKYSTSWDLYPQYCYISYADDDTCEVATDVAWADSDGCYYPQSPIAYLMGDDGSFDLSAENLAALAEDESFTNLVSKDYSASSPRSDVMQAFIWLGTPNELGLDWEIDEDCEEDCSYLADAQMDFIFQTVNEFKDDLEDSDLFFDYPGYDGFPVSVVLTDLSLCFISIFMVFFYMWWYTNSLWLTLAGFGQILGCFFTASFWYRWCWPTEQGFGYEYFNLFCCLAIFIILGIGADDIFVFLDTWAEAEELQFPNIVERLSYTYRSAGKAMFITSLTTAVSFFTNLNSNFVGIRTFGVFAGLLVITNYIAMMIMFPAAVHLYHTYWRHKTNYCCLAISKCLGLCKRGNSVKLGDSGAADGPAESVNGHKESAGVTFFRTTFADWIMKWKLAVVGFFAAWMITNIVFAAQIEGVPLVLYELLKKGYNFRDYGEAKANDFPTAADPMLAYIIWGIDEDAGLIERGSYRDYEYEWGLGEVEWDSAFQLTDPSYQMGVYTTCLSMVNAGNDSAPWGYDPDLKIQNRGMNPDYSDEASADPNAFKFGGVQCFMEELRKWEVSGTSYDADSDLFTMDNDWDDASACHNCWDYTQATGDTWPYVGSTAGAVDVPYSYATDAYWWPTVLYNMSAINPGCNCFGIWPVPEIICPQETEYLPADDRFRCTASQYNFLNELGGWFTDAGRYASWNQYLFATPLMANGEDTGDADRFAMAVVTVELKYNDDYDDYEKGLEMADAWKQWLDDFKEGVEDFDPLAPKPIVVLNTAPNWEFVNDLFRSAFVGLFLGLFLAWLVLVFATGNLVMASISIFNIMCIVVCILAFLVMADWQLGPLESICCVLVVGFSVDYTVHLADSYMESDGATRFDKVRDALASTGVSVGSGAVSTLLAAIPTLFTTVSFFFKFGVFLFITVVYSIMFALLLFPAMLLLFGPTGHQGSISHMINPYLERTYIMALEQERKENEAIEALRRAKAAGGA